MGLILHSGIKITGICPTKGFGFNYKDMSCMVLLPRWLSILFEKHAPFIIEFVFHFDFELGEENERRFVNNKI